MSSFPRLGAPIPVPPPGTSLQTVAKRPIPLRFSTDAGETELPLSAPHRRQRQRVIDLLVRWTPRSAVDRDHWKQCGRHGLHRWPSRCG